MKDTATARQRDLMRKFDLYEYPWPALLGENRAKWEAVAKLVDGAARHEHRRTCDGTMADGRTRYTPERFEGDHAFHHKKSIRLALVALLDSGIPRFLTEPSSSDEPSGRENRASDAG